MIEDDDARKRLVEGVRAGRYGLLLGAGFSVAAESADGRPLPLTAALADELALFFKKSPGHPLSRLWPALPSPEREAYLAERFLRCRIDPELLPIHHFVWRIAYSLNVDDVVEQIYLPAGGKQLVETITHRTPYTTPESLATLRCVHLHGCVLNPQDGYVFSTSQYADATVHHRAWGPALADELAVSPFIVIGCQLDEYDLEHHLARRGLVDPARQPAPSVFVDPKADDILRATAERHGFITVEGSASEFLRWLRKEVGAAPSVMELLQPKKLKSLFNVDPPEREVRIFLRQFIHVHEEEVPEPLVQQNFLRGLEPTFKDIVQNHDVIRQDVADAISWVQQRSQRRTPGVNVLLYSAPPGSGKTTLLIRIALELSRLNVPAFYFRGEERLSPIAVETCLAAMSRQGVLLIDMASDHANQLAQLAERIRGTTRSILVIACDRELGIKRAKMLLYELEPTVRSMRPLSSSEALELVGKLRSEGLLGRRASQTDQQLATDIQGRDLLIALCEIAANVRRFDEVVKSIWGLALNEASRRFMTAVALAHSFGYPLKFAIAQSISAIPAGDLLRDIGSGSLQGMVFRVGYGDEYLQAGHRVLAERLIATTVPEAELFETYVALATRIAPYVSRETIKKRTLEARLARRLLDFEPYVLQRLGQRAREFYQRIKTEWEWNSRYWEQLALVELRDGNYPTAIAHAEQAVSIEEHPLTYTTLGNVLMHSGERATTWQDGRSLFSEAIVALKEAVRLRRRDALRDEHAHHVAVTGAIRFFRKWGVKPDPMTDEWIQDLLAEAEVHLRGSIDWNQLRDQWAVAGVEVPQSPGKSTGGSLGRRRTFSRGPRQEIVGNDDLRVQIGDFLISLCRKLGTEEDGLLMSNAGARLVHEFGAGVHVRLGHQSLTALVRSFPQLEISGPSTRYVIREKAK